MPSDYIDYKVRKITESFIEEHILPSIVDKSNLLGAVVYGSSVTGFASQNSDIDVLVLLREAEQTIRGVKQYNGCKMEYFIKPIEKFLSEGVTFAKRNCPSHLALEQNGFILYDDSGFLQNILRADAEYYNSNRQKPTLNYELKFVQIENRIASLKNILGRDGKEFYMVYYNILEMIRNFHSQISGEAEIPFAKAYRIYNDENYYNNFVGKQVSNPKPSKKFVELYSQCVELQDDKAQMIANLEELFQFTQEHISINPSNYEMILK